ncbi:MAG: TonB-dependent receptor [Bacteroidales bacterium]|jgi:hypothetical protein|nr:TonB-dependent receptor [Bacteroidales bacterium]
MHFKTGFVFLFVLIATTLTSFAQTGNIKGMVIDKESREPVAFASVLLKGTSRGAVTDDNGLFSIDRVSLGEHQLRISYVGYDSLIVTVKVEARASSLQRYYLERLSIELTSLEITAEKIIAQTETGVAVNHVTPQQIVRIPSIGGVPDLAQYLQVLPGVIFTGDQGGQLYIRGGTPIQNKVLLDGLVVYNPFHSIGLFSVFDTDIIKNVQVYTAGFGAEYGGRISSIMDVKTREGNRKRLSGKVDLSTFAGKFLLEGPFLKQKNSNSTGVTYLISLKASFLEQTSKWLYRYANKDGLPYSYLDGYGKLAIETANGSKVSFFGFSFNDKVSYPNIATYDWNAWGTGMSFLFIPYNSRMIIDGNIALSSYDMNLDEIITPQRNSSITTFNIGLDFTYLMSKNTLTYGIEMLGTWTDYVFVNAYGMDKSLPSSFNSELGLYMKYKWVINNLIFEPSFRLHVFASQSYVSPEPRLAMKYNFTKDFRLKFAGGLYAQNIMGGTSDQDVVNLFYAFLTVPEDVLGDTLKGKVISHSVQKAQHAVLGLEWEPVSSMSLNIEGYVKNFSQLTNINRYQVFNREDDFILETGIAYGGDVSVKWEYKQIYLSAVYSLNFVTRDDGAIIYRTHFDRRHNVNIMASYSFGKRNCWTVDARWNFGSGFPFTKTRGFYPQLAYIPNISGDILYSNEELGIALDSLNKGQLPDYHRLDLNIKRKFHISETCTAEIGFGVTNVYNYHNIFYVNRITAEKIYQLPVLWSVNANIRF